MTPDERLAAMEELHRLQVEAKGQPAEPSMLEKLSGYMPDVVKNIGTAAYKGLTDIPAMAADAHAGGYDATDALMAASGLPPRKLNKNMPVTTALESTGYQPKTQGERYVNQGVRAATGAMMGPGSLAGRGKAALTGGIGGLAGEGAAQLPGVKGTSAEPYARITAALLGSGATAAGLSQVRNTKDIAKEALLDFKPEDLDRTLKTLQTSHHPGMPVRLNASQAVGKPTNLDNLVELLSTRVEGQPLIEQLREQPKQIKNLAERLQRTLPGTAKEPAAIANASQDAATSVIQKELKARSDAVRPYYKAAGVAPQEFLQQTEQRLAQAVLANPDTVKGALLDDLRQVFTNAKARGQGKASTLLDAKGKPFAGAENPISMEELNDSMRSLTTGLKNVNTNSKAGDKEAVGNLLAAVKGIREEMGMLSPSFKKGNDLYAEISSSVVDPLKKSVTGRVSGRSGALADVEGVNKLLPILAKGRDPKTPASSSEILKFAQDTKATPEVFQDAFKTHVSKALADVETTLVGQPAANIAEVVKQKLFATPAQQQGMRDAITGIAKAQGQDPKRVTEGFMQGLRMIEAAAKRPSNLGPSAQQFEQMAGRSKFASTVQLASLNAGNQAGKGFRGWVTSKTYQELADNLTTPEGFARLQELAKTPIMSRKAQAILNTLVTTTGQGTQVSGED
jgi:hypothetical protein